MAVKIIHDFTSVQFEADLPLEPVLMQAVEHPNVLKLFEYKVVRSQKQQERLWLVLEFCNQGTLAVSSSTLCSGTCNVLDVDRLLAGELCSGQKVGNKHYCAGCCRQRLLQNVTGDKCTSAGECNRLRGKRAGKWHCLSACQWNLALRPQRRYTLPRS